MEPPGDVPGGSFFWGPFGAFLLASELLIPHLMSMNHPPKLPVLTPLKLLILVVLVGTLSALFIRWVTEIALK